MVKRTPTKKPKNVKSTKATLIAFPIEIRDWMDRRAVEDGRSLTTIAIRALRAAMAADAAGEQRT
jgi:hypothetical protein